MNIKFLILMTLPLLCSGICTRFYNGRILIDHEICEGELWIEGAKIVSPRSHADCEVDVQGLLIAPGYIDLQMNGGFGVDFSTEPEKVEWVAAQLPQHGVTSFLPTVISQDRASYEKIIPHLKPRTCEGANLLGIHLEGPFFNPKQIGAHNPQMISLPQSPELFYGTLEGVKIVTLAPELEGSLELIEELRAKNILVSIGHSCATYAQAEQAIEKGATLVTHLFNAMPSFHHRNPGIIGLTLTESSLYYTLIVDGWHLHPSTVRLAWTSNPDKLVLMTDAIEALGLSADLYRLGTMEIEVENGKAVLKGTTTIAGSVLSLDQAVRNFLAFTGCAPVQAIEAATLRPAQVLGLEKTKGTLSVGADADFIFLDDQLYVKACYINGRIRSAFLDSDCASRSLELLPK